MGLVGSRRTDYLVDRCKTRQAPKLSILVYQGSIDMWQSLRTALVRIRSHKRNRSRVVESVTGDN